MKKRVALLLSLTMIISLAACDSVPKIPHIGRTEEETTETTLEPTESDTQETEPSETEEPAETTAAPTKKATPTPTPTPKATEPSETDEPAEPSDPGDDTNHEPVVIITQEDEEVVDYGSCTITHTRNGRSWRYEGLPDILTFSDDLLTIDIPGYDVATLVINDSLAYLNDQAEAKFKDLQESTEIPEYPQKKDTDEEGKKNRDPELEDPTWSAVVYTQTANVVLCREKAIGIRYEYSYTDAYGNTTTESEYMLFDLRTGDYLSTEDLARSAGLFGDHLYYMALALLPEVYPDANIDEGTFSKELVKVKDAYNWEIVDIDGEVVLRFWYPEGAFSVLRLEDKVFEADFEQFSMYFTSYFRSLFD